jgi:putative heme-binding domain-containing protein
LHVNGSVCHVEAGGGNAKMELEFTRANDRTSLIEARPQHDSFGISNAMLVAPGHPEQSILFYRVSRRGPGQMPPLVTFTVDDRAVSLIRDWIAQMKSERKFVRDWKMSDLLPGINEIQHDRSFESGKKVFRGTGCAQCHRFAGDGGTVGPDLTGISKRATVHDLLESIVEPSKAIAEQYANVQITMDDGRIFSGRIDSEDQESLTFIVNPLTRELARLDKAAIVDRSISKISNMPAGMINSLEQQEILDLLAYLVADGKADHASFVNP